MIWSDKNTIRLKKSHQTFAFFKLDLLHSLPPFLSLRLSPRSVCPLTCSGKLRGELLRVGGGPAGGTDPREGAGSSCSRRSPRC